MRERIQMSYSKYYVCIMEESFNLWKVTADKSEDNLSKIISTRLTQKINTLANSISVSQRKIKCFHWPGREVQACETSIWKTEPGGRPGFFRRQERGKSKEGERKSVKRENTFKYWELNPRPCVWTQHSNTEIHLHLLICLRLALNSL